jgi:hypothetical protein
MKKDCHFADMTRAGRFPGSFFVNIPHSTKPDMPSVGGIPVEVIPLMDGPPLKVRALVTSLAFRDIYGAGTSSPAHRSGRSENE